ncbi:hypothetical protein [Acinetobacter pollinis]|uniref:hypothetical protein n=1 Tax=Acinetobacter pollinis TaxID=2605270 RepID=UPI0018C30D82|nr:hypothetical protein [Acinetobacter pollinis]MBF7693970.1 hypothetical protein [Acinetobacter pollinis]MBF7701625.1 hypothetical protein [Acinetobacter pollinis]
MDEKEYKNLTGKKIHKPKPRAKPLPKAKQSYLEADELLTQQLTEYGIGFERQFQINTTKHCRFDFHIVKKRILIEIEGSPWSGGRGGKLAFKAWNMGRYDEAEERGYRCKRFHPDAIEHGYVITWLLEMFEEDEDGAS